MNRHGLLLPCGSLVLGAPEAAWNSLRPSVRCWWTAARALRGSPENEVAAVRLVAQEPLVHQALHGGAQGMTANTERFGQLHLSQRLPRRYLADQDAAP
jgi:hypothetical protein